MSDAQEIVDTSLELPPVELGDSTTKAKVAPAPVAPAERIDSIDVVRGFALLGILAMNISIFALPMTYFNPTLAGGFTRLNFAVWLIDYLVFAGKMMSIFSMLFGAGLLLLTDRAEARGGKPAKVFYRRAGVLLVFGLLHAYLLWDGDILYSYALGGMIAYLFRKRSAFTLIVVGVLVLLPPIAFARGFGSFLDRARAAAARVAATPAAGNGVSTGDQRLAEAWNGMRSQFEPDAKGIERTIRIYGRGSYLKIARERAPESFYMQTMLFVTVVGWVTLGRILIGMGLMKLGVFSGGRSRRFYVALMLVGYGLGLPLVAAGAYGLVRNQFDVAYKFGGGMDYNSFGSILVALGHVGALLLLYKAGVLQWLTRRLAAVGRMALSNYLAQTIICTTLFYGYGFGLFGKLDRLQLAGVVLAIWVLQLWYSPIWLKYFRFGPFEWLWRTLTYGKAQPMRVAATA